MPEWLFDASAWVLPVVLAVTLHEAAHGWMAEKFGDLTARSLGRVSFNPLRHIDRFGTIVLPGLLMLVHSPFLFGYAKPVPVDFPRLNPPRLGMLAVALAGPGTNVLLALAAGFLLHLGAYVSPEDAPWLFMNLYRALLINCVLAVFNMIPLLPLDGGRVVDAVLPNAARLPFRALEKFGVPVVMFLLLVPPMLGYNVFLQLMGVPTFWLLEQVMWITGNSQTVV